MRAAAIVLLLAGACGGDTVRRAPPPLRPQPRAVAQEMAPSSRTDCSEVEVSDGPAPLSYDERSVEEANNLADQGFAMLEQSALAPENSGERERLLEQAVHRFVTSLLADPYNVHATYNLAAAYARIGRGQCAVNLLSRLVPLRKLPSQRSRVEEKLDRLLGRKGYRGRLDPDFLWLRDDPRFRDLVKQF